MEIIISRILLIAEEKQIVDDLLDYFEPKGYEAEIALNTKIAIDIINERDMSLVIIGYKDQKSIETDIIEQLRDASPIPIIVIGGEKSKRTENKIIKAGAQKFIPSPVENGELLLAVKEILNKGLS